MFKIVILKSYYFYIVICAYYLISQLLYSYDAMFTNINNAIDNDIELYKACEKDSQILLCGRNKTTYKKPSVKIKIHQSYIPYSIIALCFIYNAVSCSNTEILVSILVRPELLYERMITRRIFNKLDYIKYIFITGIGGENEVNEIILKEKNKFNDIIFFNISSSYYNCSAIMTCYYIYLYNNCFNVKWILKLDIDTYCNIKKIVNITKTISKNISVIGSIRKSPMLSCNRLYKWSIDCGNKTKNSAKIPSYPYGPAFLFKFSSIKCIYSYYSNKNAIIWIEDVLFGYLMKFCYLKYLDITYITDITYKPKNNLSLLKEKVFVHGLNPIEILYQSLYI